MKLRTRKCFILLFVTAIAVLFTFLLSACMDDCIHQFGEWTPLFDANCQTEGMDVRSCPICGYSETQTHPKTDHTYGAVRITDRPTCIDTGRGTKTCTVCGTSATVTLPVNPLAHQWKEISRTPATCTEEGEVVRQCQLCETIERTPISPSHQFADTFPCHDRTCTVCNTVIAGDGNHTFINDACACGTPHPDFTLAKAAERIRKAMAKTLAHDDDFSVTVMNGSSLEITTFFPLLGELALFYGSEDTTPTLAAYTLRLRGSLYYYDLAERNAYLASASIFRQQISIAKLYGNALKKYELSDEESNLTGFSFSPDGALTLTAALPLTDGTVTYTERNGILAELTFDPAQNSGSPQVKYTFDLAPTDKITNHQNGFKDSDFTILDTYTVRFIAIIDKETNSLSAKTGAPSPLPVGDEAYGNYQIDGWYYDAEFTEPYEESNVPYTPIPLTLYAKTSLKPNVTYLTLHIVGADISPMRWSFPAGDGTYLENALRAAFPTPSQSALTGLYNESAFMQMGLFSDSDCTIPLGDTLPAGEVTAYLKVEPYANLILKFPTDLPAYPADLSYYYPKNAVPHVSAEAFLNELNSRTGKCFTLWLDAAYTVPYAGTLPENTYIYLKHVPHENYTFVSYLNAETGALLTRIEAELNYAVYLLNPVDFDDPVRQLVCTGIWFDSACTQSAVGELVTPEGELILYCTFDLALPETQTFGQDMP